MCLLGRLLTNEKRDLIKVVQTTLRWPLLNQLQTLLLENNILNPQTTVFLHFDFFFERWAMVKGRKEGRGLWTNRSVARVRTCWSTDCKTISQPGPKLVASSSNRQAVRTPDACQTPPCLQWARILQVCFRPCRTRVCPFLGW